MGICPKDNQVKYQVKFTQESTEKVVGTVDANNYDDAISCIMNGDVNVIDSEQINYYIDTDTIEAVPVIQLPVDNDSALPRYKLSIRNSDMHVIGDDNGIKWEASARMGSNKWYLAWYNRENNKLIQHHTVLPTLFHVLVAVQEKGVSI